MSTCCEYLLIEHVHPRPGPLAGPHWHPVVTETFSVKEGKMRFRVDGQELVLGPGESIAIRPGQVHRFWNVGEERLVAVEEVRPPGRHWEMFELMHRLHCAGKTNEQDIPRNPLLLGLLWERIDGYIAGPPVLLQKLVLGGLARLARIVGYEDKWAGRSGEQVRAQLASGQVVAGALGERRKTRAMHVEDSRVFNRPVQEVFDYMADPANLPKWSGPAVEVRGIQHARPGTLGEGDKFTPIHHFLGRRLEEHVEVTAFEPNRRILHRATGGPMPLVVSYIFEEGPRGTRLTIGMDAEPEGFFKLMGPVFMAAVKRQIRKDLQTLKELLENQET